MTYEDILFDSKDGIARITINRPSVMNAFRGRTCEELINAFNRAGWDKSVGVIVLGGAGNKAFCTGGDQSAHQGQYDGRGMIGLPVEELHSIIRDVPKPVIARVQGYAIGGGNVLATICDFTIASEKAVFGQVGPKVGSVDPGFGTAYLARVVGERRRAKSGICAGATPRRRRCPSGSSTQWSRTTNWMPRWDAGARRSWSAAPPPSPSPSARSMPTATISAASLRWGCRRSIFITLIVKSCGCF